MPHMCSSFSLNRYTQRGKLYHLTVYSFLYNTWWRYVMETLAALLALNTLRPRQNGRHCADDIFKCILLNENVWIPNKISLKFVPKGPINNIPSLVQIMAWRRPGDKPLSEPIMVSSLTHICVTRPQWVAGGDGTVIYIPGFACQRRTKYIRWIIHARDMPTWSTRMW